MTATAGALQKLADLPGTAWGGPKPGLSALASFEEREKIHALLELRHARLRVELAAVEIDYATSMLSAGSISADGALRLLDEAIEDLAGGAP